MKIFLTENEDYPYENQYDFQSVKFIDNPSNYFTNSQHDFYPDIFRYESQVSVEPNESFDEQMPIPLN